MTKDFSKIGLGEGKFFIDYGESGEIDAGYVRGGSFNSNLTMRHIEVDGKKGQVVGDAVYEAELPQLDFVAMQMDASLLPKIFVNMAVVDNEDGTATVTRSNAHPTADDYLTNVTYVGQTKDGTAIIIKVLNALGEGPINLTFTDKGEIEIPALFTGNYESTDDTNAPFEITIPYSDSVIPPAWIAETAYSLNDKVTADGSIYMATTAGTSGASEPTWPESGTVEDGTVTWTYQA